MYYNTDSRYMFYQTFHEKKIPQGYVASLALTPDLKSKIAQLEKLYNDLLSGNARPLIAEVQKNNIDLIVLHKTFSGVRKPFIPRMKIQAPFFIRRRGLVKSRQVGPFIDRPLVKIPQKLWEFDQNVDFEVLRDNLKKELGEPRHEDSEVVVFDPNP
jgi:hypothetical protein